MIRATDRRHLIATSSSKVSARRRLLLAQAVESLEPRRLLCGGHYDFSNFAIDFPAEAQMIATLNSPARGTKAKGQLSSAPNSAVINWSNRGSSGDNFNSTFGANATVAREVVDAVLRHYERVITSFNHFNDVNVINVSISMDSSGTGHGGGAGSYGENAAGQPTSGAIVLDRGDDLTGDGKGDGGGYFLDPTPDEYSEFAGTITNAFAVDAQAGSPAAGKSDLYTLVAAEITHVLGINSGSNLYTSRAHYTNTNIPDTAEGGGVGKFWVYDSPIIKHLMTSNNGGASGSDKGKPIHGAGPGVPIVFNGQTWVGAEDSMNAVYEFGRRYLVPETSRLIMQDGLLYSTVPAQTFGTAYTILNQTARTLTVRGAAGASNDVITVDFLNNKIVVTVDVPVDFAGTWTSPGGGDFPAWRSEFSPIDFDSIIINAGDGNDTIRIYGTHPLQTTTVNAGNGNDFIQVGDGFIDTGIISQVNVFGGSGTDTLSYNDAFDDIGNDSYQITSTYIQKSANYTRATYGTDIEAITVLGSTTNNTFNVDSTIGTAGYTLYGLGGDDTFNIVPGAGTSMDVQGGVGNNTLRMNDLAGGAANYTVNNSVLIRTGAPNFTHSSIQNVILDASNFNNTINVATTNGSPFITINGNNGDDVVIVDATQYTGIGAHNAISVNGGAGNDGMSTFVRLGGVIGLLPTQILGNGPTINYGTIEQCDLIGGQLGETFAIYSTAAGVSTQIFAGLGNDTIYFGGAFGQPYTLDNIQGPVTVRGEGGVDVMALVDNSQTANRTYNISSLGVSAPTMATAAYDSSVEGLVMYGGSGHDTFNVLSTLVGTQVTLNGNGGNDAFFVTNMASTGFVTIDGGTAFDYINVNDDAVGTARVLIRNSQLLGGLNIFTGGTAVIEAGANAIIETQQLFMNTVATLDLNDNDLILDYTGASQLALQQSRINSGRNGGAWNGNGIRSTVASNRNPKNTTLGAIEASDYKLVYGSSALFDGRSIDSTAVLIKYTYYGDTDFNGVVNFDDYSRADNGFSTNKTGWFNGDFDGNGIVNFDDYSLIDLAFNSQLAPL